MDNTRGEIKQLRGSGPPILTVEGNSVSPEQILFVMRADGGWASRGELPMTAQVIGIDLTRRTVRLQVIGGREILYCATGDDSGRNGAYWIFDSADCARAHAERQCGAAVKNCEAQADKALQSLEQQKEKLAEAMRWTPRQFEDDD